MPSWTSTEIVAALIGGVFGFVGSVLAAIITLVFTEKGQRLRAAATHEAQVARDLRDAKLAVVRAMSDAEHQIGTVLQMVSTYPDRIEELFNANEQKMNVIRTAIQGANVSLGLLDPGARDRLFNGPIRQLSEMDTCIDMLYRSGGDGRVGLFRDTCRRYQDQMLNIVTAYPAIADGIQQCPRLYLPGVARLHRKLAGRPLKMILDGEAR